MIRSKPRDKLRGWTLSPGLDFEQSAEGRVTWVARRRKPWGKIDNVNHEPGGRHVMFHAYTKNHIHIVFATKERQKLVSKETQPKLWGYMAGVCRNVRVWVHAIGGLDDHVHALLELPPIMSVAKAVNLLKSNSSRWLSRRGTRFSRQEGYGAFSVSASILPEVIQYIRNQEAHHRERRFEQEFALLRKHGVKFDPTAPKDSVTPLRGSPGKKSGI